MQCHKRTLFEKPYSACFSLKIPNLYKTPALFNKRALVWCYLGYHHYLMWLEITHNTNINTVYASISLKVNNSGKSICLKGLYESELKRNNLLPPKFSFFFLSPQFHLYPFSFNGMKTFLITPEIIKRYNLIRDTICPNLLSKNLTSKYQKVYNICQSRWNPVILNHFLFIN